MISDLKLRNGLKRIAKPAATLLFRNRSCGRPKALLDYRDKTSAVRKSAVAER